MTSSEHRSDEPGSSAVRLTLLSGKSESAALASFGLAASSEPAEVFSSLVGACVPTWCDACSVDLVHGTTRLRLTHPAGQPGPYNDSHTVRVSFAVPAQHYDVHAAAQLRADPAEASADSSVATPFHGVASFSWDVEGPDERDRTTAALLVEHAVCVVNGQRAETAAHAASIKAHNLTIALRNSRGIGAAIGIVMATHKVTEEQAFSLLRAGSQHAHRKLRDLAADVLETGWIDPALLSAAAKHKVLNDPVVADPPHLVDDVEEEH